jgi:hypothetical protein
LFLPLALIMAYVVADESPSNPLLHTSG